MIVHSQHLTALERANQIRSERTTLKRRVANGSTSVATVLERVPECVATLPLVDLLSWQQGWGEFRSTRLCRMAGVNAHRLLSELTYRQCGVLLRHLDPRSDAEPVPLCARCGGRMLEPAVVCGLCLLDEEAA